MTFSLPKKGKEKVALAIYDSKPSEEEMKLGKKPAFLTAADIGEPFFVYTSGRVGPYYIDLRVLPSFPKNYKAILTQLIWLLDTVVGSENIDCIISTESAGISWGQSIANYFDLPFAYARKEPKTYGTKKFIEGHIPKGAKVFNIDDLVTTLKSVKKAVEGARAEGAEVLGSEVIFNRKQYTSKDLEELDAPLYWLIDIIDFVKIGIEKHRLDKEIGSQILTYHNNEGLYARRVIEENIDLVKSHPKKEDILSAYEKIYAKTKDENFGLVVKLLKKL
ncbi:MAG TPA: hypothetical protein ENF38_01275 [Candidatus Aenigmarchaeota archaeon]|nr:hypothetical protein [Candidatus Aenigmarchaeota archaeon]